jgi:hypothetical protein
MFRFWKPKTDVELTVLFFGVVIATSVSASVLTCLFMMKYVLK